MPEARPREKRQTQVDRGCVESVDGCVLEFLAEVFVRIEPPGLVDEDVGEVGIDSPIAYFVGIGQGVAGDPTANAHVVKLRLHGAKTGFDVAQAFAVGQLGKGHDKKLIETSEALGPCGCPDIA